MDFSDIAIAAARHMLILWTLGAVARKLKSNSKIICDKIELAKKILNFIGEAPEWVNYNKNLKDHIRSLKDEMQKLLDVKDDVDQEVRMLELQTNKKRKSEVNNWLTNVEKKAEEVGNVERMVDQTRATWRFLFRAWLGSCVETKKKEVIELRDQKGTFGRELVINAHHGNREKLVTIVLVGQVAARNKEEIWRHLTSQEVTILGVEGERGMGKSAMMMHIYNLVLDCPDLFDCAFYVNVKEDYGVCQLQAAIGEELKLQGLHDEDHEYRKAAMIYEALKLRKRYVLVLDGLMSDFQLKKVGIPVGEGGGGKLVVVTQCERVCRIMCCQPVIRLGKLPYEDSRELFMEMLKPSVDLSGEIEDAADEIIRKCNGVPLRIVEASESLRNVDDVSKWRTKLSEM